MNNQRSRRGRSANEKGFADAGDKRPLLVYMQALLPSLHRKERMIAEYMLADPERVISSSIAELREGCGASVGAIVGFCRRLGPEGFANFKIELARELAQGGLPGNGAKGRGGKPFSKKSFTFTKTAYRKHSRSTAKTL